MRVFVVEDEALLAFDLCDILADLGHEVIGPVPSVAKALALIEKLEELPNAAIVDVNLTGEMSNEIVALLKKLNVPVILATGYNGDELVRLGLSGSGFVAKPYNKKQIAEALVDLNITTYSTEL